MKKIHVMIFLGRFHESDKKIEKKYALLLDLEIKKNASPHD